LAKLRAARSKGLDGVEEETLATTTGEPTSSAGHRTVERQQDLVLILNVLRTRGRLLAVLILSVSMALLLCCGSLRDSVVCVPVVGVLGPVLAVLDVELLRLPNRVVLPAIPFQLTLLAAAAAASGQSGALVRSVCAALITALFLGALAVFSGGGFGWGDVKVAAGLLAPILGWFGWPLLVAAGWLAFVSAALMGTLRRRRGGADSFAFGPYLIAAAMAVLLWRGIHG